MDEFVTDSLSVSASDIYSNFSQLVLNLFHEKRIHLCFLLNCNGYYNMARIFSGIYLSGRKTPIGPVASHAKNPIIPFGLGLNFLLFFRQLFLK